jgi:hypothetical protein
LIVVSSLIRVKNQVDTGSYLTYDTTNPKHIEVHYMPESNCYTFNASTGVLTPEIQLEKHNVLQVGIEEHNREKKHVKVCPQNPPRNFDQQTLRLRTAQLLNDRLVHTNSPNEVTLHVIESHKIKARKDSSMGVTIRGSRTAVVGIRKGSGVTINNSNRKWHVALPKDSLAVEIVSA